jgi:hypothetical protein
VPIEIVTASPPAVPVWRRELRAKLACAAALLAYDAAGYMLLNRVAPGRRLELPRLSVLDDAPIVPWTIVLYVSVWHLVGAAILLLPDLESVKRYFRASVLAFTATFVLFLALPTRMERPPLPECGPLWLWACELTRAIDLPHTCFPSLHVVKCVLPVLAVWGTRAAGAFALWGLAIAASTLTTGQHLFIDIPAGALVAYGSWRWTGRSTAPPARESFF